MKHKHTHLDKIDSRERANEFRDAILSADATGMIAGEELITEAETMLPTLREKSARPRDHA
ncbi:MAG: hypothetical protein HKL92_09845 [Candidatus Eremiobacteraeota bacterium]|nr:hypothetical protein [Candidatus Eremiobacteraeota bacterium]